MNGHFSNDELIDRLYGVGRRAAVISTPVRIARVRAAS